MGAFYCAVCRQTDFSGKGHIYGKSHQCKLKVVLVKFIEKVKEARRSVKRPQVVKSDFMQHEGKFWCYCCALEVQKHVADGSVTVLHGGLLEHMSTREHRTNTHAFWWRNKADPKLRDKVIITEEEIERFKAEVAKAIEQYEENEDTLIKEQAAIIRSQEHHRLEVLQSLIEPEPEWRQSAEQGQQVMQHTTCMSADMASSFQASSHDLRDQAGPSYVDPFLQRQWAEPEHGLTFIGHQDSSGSGNVHTGAMPPWLLEEPDDEGMASTQQEIGPSLQEFLKHKEQEKLKKLPANRVGANFDHGSCTDADWLPSFGRVWNSGRRWQSRHQFRQEEARGRRKRRRERGGKATAKQNHLYNGDL
ncbi:coiled-coil domain-containing protein 84 isoform X2 [Electrophorus electricus]|uniref:coiled-coil domain-containing protein 84 isoform X2 n=1 Tax=Electrophorus electricus TaxID=8005 RepID=UPI0015CF945A|nr:coiled-coil domain-containing protein 84 isoform X2 [Electrophorus electricus]